MTNEALLDSVREQLQAGLSRDDIRRAIKEGGWNDQDIDEAFALVDGKPLPTDVEAPLSGATATATPLATPPRATLAARILGAPSSEIPSGENPQVRRWPLIALVAGILLLGSAAAAFAMVPSVRSFVLSLTPFAPDQAPTPPLSATPPAGVILEPVAEPLPLPPEKTQTPTSPSVPPVSATPTKPEDATPPPPSTTQPAVDSTAPVVTLTAPASGVTVSGSSVVVSASASDKIGVVSVQFALDGNALGSADAVAPYRITWDTTKNANGKHTLSATARDAAGNVGTSANITDTVSNDTSTSPPTPPDTLAPATPADLSVTVVSPSRLDISWSASTDAVGVTGYKLERCTGSSCTNYAEIATPSGTSHNDTSLSAATTYRYRVRATDAAGNLSGYSTAVSGTTQAAAPTTVTVSMGENAYSPVNLTIALGTTVIFRNDWTSDRWPASDSHPSHNIYPAFDPLGPVAPGDSWSFTFTQVGQWGYHDHIKPSIGGLITVQ